MKTFREACKDPDCRRWIESRVLRFMADVVARSNGPLLISEAALLETAGEVVLRLHEKSYPGTHDHGVLAPAVHIRKCRECPRTAVPGFSYCHECGTAAPGAKQPIKLSVCIKDGCEALAVYCPYHAIEYGKKDNEGIAKPSTETPVADAVMKTARRLYEAWLHNYAHPMMGWDDVSSDTRSKWIAIALAALEPADKDNAPWPRYDAPVATFKKAGA